MKKNAILLGFFYLFLVQFLYSRDFLNFSIGARASSLGGACETLSFDPTASRYNPSSLSFSSGNKLYIMFTRLWEDTSYNFVGYSSKFKKYNYAFSLYSLSSDNFVSQQTVFDEPTYFSIKKQALFITVSKKFKKFISFGGNFKFAKREIFNSSDSSIGIDIASMYKKDKLGIGFKIANLIPLTFKDDKYPLILSFGSSYEVDYKKINNLILSLGIEKYGTLSPNIKFGFEYNPINFVSLRFGYSDEISFGWGLNYKNFNFNYALLFHPLGNNQRIDLVYSWGGFEKEGISSFTMRLTKKRAKEYWKKGLKYYNEGKYELALAEWDKALIWEPANSEIEEKVKEVSSKLEELVTRKLIEKYLTDAYSFYSKGKLKDSLKAWEEVLLLDPGNLRAKEYIEKIKNKLSEEERRKVLEELEIKKKAKITSLIREGQKLYEKKKFKKAILVWRKVFKYDPKNDKAVAKIKKAKNAIDTVFTKYVSIGREKYQKNNFSEAIKYLRLALKYKKDKNTENILEQAKLKIKSQKKIGRAVRKKLEKLYFKAADLYLKQDYAGSKKILDEILNIDPTDENAIKLKEKVEATLELLK